MAVRAERVPSCEVPADSYYGALTDLGFLEEKCTHVAVAKTGEGEDERTVYNGVFELQEDYRRALAVWPEEMESA
jgi:hypothetical protein